MAVYGRCSRLVISDRSDCLHLHGAADASVVSDDTVIQTMVPSSRQATICMR